MYTSVWGWSGYKPQKPASALTDSIIALSLYLNWFSGSRSRYWLRKDCRADLDLEDMPL